MDPISSSSTPHRKYNITTTTTSTMKARPIVSAVPSPPLSPKRKYFDNYDIDDIISKKPRLSSSESTEETPNSPLYKNFGNGLSVCNNTKTNRFANIDEILEYLSYDDDDTISKENVTNYTFDNIMRHKNNRHISNKLNSSDINEKTLSEEVLNDFIDDLHETKELPELHLNLWDLRDMLRLDLELL